MSHKKQRGVIWEVARTLCGAGRGHFESLGPVPLAPALYQTYQEVWACSDAGPREWEMGHERVGMWDCEMCGDRNRRAWEDGGKQTSAGSWMYL